jgi:hypothetical protein
MSHAEPFPTAAAVAAAQAAEQAAYDKDLASLVRSSTAISINLL